MDLITMEAFQPVLRAELERFKTVSGKKDWSDVLARWVAGHFLGLSPKEVDEACMMQGPGEEGVDLFWKEDGRKRIVVGQAEAGDDLALGKDFGRGIVDKLRRALSALNDPEIAANRKHVLSDAANQYQEVMRRRFSVEFWPIVAGRADKGLTKALRRFGKVDLSMYENHSAELIDAGSLLAKYCAEVERYPYPDIELVLDSGELVEHGRNASVATVTAKSIAEAVEKSGLHIFETNARLPLLNAPVNKEIARTLNDPIKRRYFWYYNNGLTVLCEKFAKNGGKLRLERAQIVNGCQTAHTLRLNRDKLKGVSVLVRIVAGIGPGIAQDIRRATNRQTAVTERDLRSGDPVQKNLQRRFQQMGYFYQRKKLEHKNAEEELGKLQLKRQFERGRVDNLELAQLSLAFWHQRPSSAKMERKKLFVKPEDPSEKLPAGFYDMVFHEGVTSEEILLPYLLYNYLYENFDVGFHGRELPKGAKYQVLTHGDLTILALTGKVLKDSYRLRIPSPDALAKRRLESILVPRFEPPWDRNPEFFKPFGTQVERMIAALRVFIKGEQTRRDLEDSSTDIRDIFVSAKTYPQALRHSSVRRALHQARNGMPTIG